MKYAILYFAGRAKHKHIHSTDPRAGATLT